LPVLFQAHGSRIAHAHFYTQASTSKMFRKIRKKHRKTTRWRRHIPRRNTSTAFVHGRFFSL